jgi:hypothetical protein
VHDVHEVHPYFDSIPLSPFFAVEGEFEAMDFLHSSQPLPKPTFGQVTAATFAHKQRVSVAGVEIVQGKKRRLQLGAAYQA